jgi:hypothetical protein
MKDVPAGELHEYLGIRTVNYVRGKGAPARIDRAAAGYSPDRVDALVWAFSELLVEPMKSEGIFELCRRNAEAAEPRDKPQPTQTTWAIGSMEWLAEQKRSR